MSQLLEANKYTVMLFGLRLLGAHYASTLRDDYEGPKTATRGGVNGSRKFSSEIFLAAVPNHHQIQTSIRN